MKTEKLYDIDSHLKSFSATVLSCDYENEKYSVILDKTAFFPEGGGQSSDKGEIDGIEVFDVQIKDGVIYHFTLSAVEPGKTVKCSIDFERRFSFMQNHSAEHICSGIIHSKYGYDNVGFHLGEDFVTLDFNGMFCREQLDEIELEANKKIWQNVKFKAYYPDDATLSKLEYRSKKELEGDIRIVEIEDTDICACCAPHVNSACEIGIIKLLDTEKMRNGTRITMKAGGFALSDYRNKYLNSSKISNYLSCKHEETAHFTNELLKKTDKQKYDISKLKKKIIDLIISSSNGNKSLFLEEELDIKELQLLADGLHKAYGGLKAAFSGKDGLYNFAICAKEQDLNEFFGKFKNELNVRGGGRNGMVQGTVFENMEKIKLYF